MSDQKRIYLVYEDRRGDNQKVFYVGKGTYKRFLVVMRNNIHWMRIAKKGKGYSRSIIKSKLTEQEALDLEKQIIAKYGRQNLANFTEGGDGMLSPSKEVRDKMSLAKLGKHRSFASRIKQANSTLGSKNHFYGKKHTQATKYKISLTKIIQHLNKQK